MKELSGNIDHILKKVFTALWEEFSIKSDNLLKKECRVLILIMVGAAALFSLLFIGIYGV